MKKREYFEEKARIYKSLSHPLRCEILSIIEREGLCNVKIITNETKHSQPNVSHHLKILSSTGIVKGRREGNRVLYSIDNNIEKDGFAWR